MHSAHLDQKCACVLRLKTCRTWIGYAQLIGSLLVHPDLVPHIEACLDLHHRVCVALSAVVKGRAVQLLSRLGSRMICVAPPAFMLLMLD